MTESADTTCASGTTVAGRYLVGEVIGSGGMGDVHAAFDEQEREKVAIKFLKLRPADTSEGAIARFEVEARATAKLGHPNIIRLIDFQKAENGMPFLVMEHLVGESLHARIKRDGSIPMREAAEFHQQILEALAQAHRAKVLHRDIKPENVFLTEQEDGTTVAKLLDFGLAYLLEERDNTRLTATGQAIGTPAYMAPERLKGEFATESSDVFSVGVSLFESLSGTLPFPGQDLRERAGRILFEAPEELAGINAELDAKLGAIVYRALEKEPAKRHAGAGEMASLLGQWLEDPGRLPDPGPDGGRSIPPSGKATVKPKKIAVPKQPVPSEEPLRTTRNGAGRGAGTLAAGDSDRAAGHVVGETSGRRRPFMPWVAGAMATLTVLALWSFSGTEGTESRALSPSDRESVSTSVEGTQGARQEEQPLPTRDAPASTETQPRKEASPRRAVARSRHRHVGVMIEAAASEATTESAAAPDAEGAAESAVQTRRQAATGIVEPDWGTPIPSRPEATSESD